MPNSHKSFIRPQKESAWFLALSFSLSVAEFYIYLLEQCYSFYYINHLYPCYVLITTDNLSHLI